MYSMFILKFWREGNSLCIESVSIVVDFRESLKPFEALTLLNKMKKVRKTFKKYKFALPSIKGTKQLWRVNIKNSYLLLKKPPSKRQRSKNISDWSRV